MVPSESSIDSQIAETGCLSVIDFIRRHEEDNRYSNNAIEYYGNEISREEYWDCIARYRSFLLSIGIEKGEPVTICMLNSPEYEFIYAALLENGSIASTVSKSFIIADIKRQTIERGAKTLILGVEYLDDFIKNDVFGQLANSKSNIALERIILTSATHYMPHELQRKQGNQSYREMIDSLGFPKDIRVFYPEEVILDIENRSTISLPSNNLINEIATYSNTGGTTGAPKCAMHTHRAIISLLMSHEREMYKDFNLKDNSRSLLVIPISHITSQFYALLTRRAFGATIIYNPFSFEAEHLRRILIDEKIDDVTLPFGLLYAITRAPFKKGELKLHTPCCGGEPTPYHPTKDVNNRLHNAGCDSIVIGTGSTEFGSGLMGSYSIENRSNESGCFFPYATGFIVDPKTGKKINDIGKRGIFYANAPWQMLGYLNDEVATQEFFNIEENGKKYGTNNDIVEIVGEHDGKPIYSMLGRAGDFVITDNRVTYYQGVTIDKGKVTDTNFEQGCFLFDLRDVLLNIEGIMEAQPLILHQSESTSEGYPVANITIQPDFSPKDILSNIYKEIKKKRSLVPAGIHFLSRFERSLSSDKRETMSLQDIRNNYYYVDDSDAIFMISFPYDESPKRAIVKDTSAIRCENPPAPRMVFTNMGNGK